MNSMTTILIVEDDERIRNALRAILVACGYSVQETGNARTALAMTASHNPDLMLLDLGLPDGDGMELIRSVRGWSQVPIIVVSARGYERDKVEALDSGADDYITKPFGTDELLARIRAALRHGRARSGNAAAVYQGKGLKVDAERRLVTVDGQPVHLTQTEYRIVLLLCRHSGRVLTYDFMIRELWGPFSGCDTQILRVNMANIRRKLERDPSMPEYITTEIGVGYRMIELDTESE